MKLSVQRIFKWLLFVFFTFATCFALLGIAETYLPANRVTHECKPTEVILIPLNSLQFETDYEQAFCQQNYHVEFKASWVRAINNIVVPGSLLAGLLMLPAGVILIIRRFTPKK